MSSLALGESLPLYVYQVVQPKIDKTIRYILANENRRRDAEAEMRSDDFGETYIEEVLADGTTVDKKVDKVIYIELMCSATSNGAFTC